MKDALERIRAGRVKRFHTLETLGENTVGQHTFNMLIIADAAYEGNPPPTLMQGILYHDLPELYTGDTPYYTKRENHGFSTRLAELETRIKQLMGLTTNMTIEDKRVLRFIDLLEALSFIVAERALGNTNMEGAFYKTTTVVSGLYPRVKQIVDYNLIQFHKALIDNWNEVIA